MGNKLSKVFYQSQNLWVASKAIRELHKATGISRADIKSLLARQALWQVYSSHPKEINQPHYEVTKLKEQHQYDLLYIPNGFRCCFQIQSGQTTDNKESKQCCICSRDSIQKGSTFNYLKVLSCDNGPEFKRNVTKRLQEKRVQIPRASTKYKHRHTAFVESLNKALDKFLS